MRSLRSLAVTFTLCALSLGSHCATASAQDAFFTTGTYTIDSTDSVINDAFIGLDSSFHFKDGMGNPYDATVNLVAGGSVGANIDVYNSSQVNVSGGSVGSYIDVYNSSQVNISGGSVGNDLAATSSSQASISGGSVGSYLYAIDNSSITVSGGTFGQYNDVNFFDGTTGTFTLVGNNLTATNIGANPHYVGGMDYDLSGTLLNGTNLSGYVLYVGNSSNFTLRNAAATPEPGNVALVVSLALSGMAFLARRRCK